MSYLNITSADAVMMLQMDQVIPNPVRVDHFSADMLASIDQTTFGEARMGVDGHLAVGYIPAPVNLTIKLEAGSNAQQLLANAYLAFRNNKTTYDTTITIDVNALKKRYVYSVGTMIAGNTQENLGKTLEPTEWKFVFEQCEVSTL